jgi:NAD(P)H-dependent FMN reductase
MQILAVSGSLQQRSANAALLHAACKQAPEGVSLVRYEGLAELPAFNPEREDDPALAAVRAWREQLRAADAVLIATPEYAHGMPGALKNALDWVVGSGELVGKPVALWSASPGATGGVRALLSLTQVLSAMNAFVVESMMVPQVRQKLDAAGEVADAETLARIGASLRALARMAGASSQA